MKEKLYYIKRIYTDKDLKEAFGIGEDEVIQRIKLPFAHLFGTGIGYLEVITTRKKP